MRQEAEKVTSVASFVLFNPFAQKYLLRTDYYSLNIRWATGQMTFCLREIYSSLNDLHE